MRTSVSSLPWLLFASTVTVVAVVACGSSSSDDTGSTATSDAGTTSTTTDAGGGTSSSSSGGSDAGPPAPTTYTVGGTVTGLEGKGLVLQNNDGDDLAVDANGAFTFKTKLASGKPFKVAVKTQPTGPKQVCTVSGFEGQVASGNVTSVTVNCSTSTFTVGGTATGIAGSGLVLQDNAGDDLTLNANGSFSFAKPLKDGAAYAVTVKTQPTNPSQTCAVTNGTGTVAGANVTTVAVACTTNTYAVGGNVTGLTAGSVVLTDNGGDDKTVDANGAFTFATKVASKGAYAVAVKTQPPGQYCVVTNGSGTVASADVTNVAVACSSVTSCKAVKALAANATSGVYSINPAGTPYAVYCDMTTDGGGWTLAMKGTFDSAEFVYQSAHWTTNDTLNEASTNLTLENAKFGAFNDVPFTDVIVQTKNTNGDGTIKVPNPTPDTTLLARFQGASYQTTALGRAAWVASQNGTDLQLNCNREGFNLDSPYVKARLGLEANQENTCDSSDSVVGLGVWANPSCGNNAGPFSTGYHSAPGCPPQEVANPPVAGLGAGFWVWVR